jgi:hypothetical protein
LRRERKAVRRRPEGISSCWQAEIKSAAVARILEFVWEPAGRRWLCSSMDFQSAGLQITGGSNNRHHFPFISFCWPNPVRLGGSDFGRAAVLAPCKSATVAAAAAFEHKQKDEILSGWLDFAMLAAFMGFSKRKNKK